jgi:hypothetical protein
VAGADGGNGLVPVRTFQPTFAAGELAPGLHRRSDLAKWRSGAAQLQNFIVTAHGGAARRAGTQFVTLAKDPTGTQRLIPFQFSTEQQYVIEAGNAYFRFITGAAYVMNGSVPYEIATPYSFTKLFELNFVQSADVLTIVHPDYQPMELRRLGTTNWTLTALPIGTNMPAPTGVTVTPSHSVAVTGSPTPADLNYIYAVTATSISTHDEGPISAPVSCSNKDLGYYKQYGYVNTVAWSAVTGADYYTVYRQFQGVWAKIGSTIGLAFEDQNYLPNTADGPPVGQDPFTGDNWPGTVGYFQERRVFGGSNSQPETLWFSRTGNYTNFDTSDPVKDDDAITYTLAARQVNQVRHLLPLADLMVMTGGGGWKVSAQGAVTPSNIDVAPQSFVGASKVPPIVIGNRILFVEAKGSSVREIAYQFVQNQYVSEDRSVFAQHLFLGHNIVSWAWSEAPDKILWAVRDDGVLLSLTYLIEQDVYAWAEHTTAGGLFRGVTVITEQIDTNRPEDVPYFVVLRAGVGSVIERMHTRRLGTANNEIWTAWHLDCALRYSGAPASVISGLSQFNDGQTVQYLADGVWGTTHVSGGAITLLTPASTVLVGLPVVGTLQTLPADSTKPGEEPWLGRLKRGFRARLAVENTAGVTVSVDGKAVAAVVDPDTGTDPAGMVTGVLDARPGEGWAREGQVSIRCETPLPATILGLALEWGVGE